MVALRAYIRYVIFFGLFLQTNFLVFRVFGIQLIFDEIFFLFQRISHTLLLWWNILMLNIIILLLENQILFFFIICKQKLRISLFWFKKKLISQFLLFGLKNIFFLNIVTVWSEFVVWIRKLYIDVFKIMTSIFLLSIELVFFFFLSDL